MIIDCEPGIFQKKALYNWLVADGFFLPHFTSNCITIESLNNFRSDRYHLYYSDELVEEIQSPGILVGHVEVAYKFLQHFHYTKFGKPLPFRQPPSEEYIRVIVKHVDLDNAMDFLKTEHVNVYDYDVITVDGQLIKQEKPQGQGVQRIVDRELNNATRLFHSRMANSIKINELTLELMAIKATFSTEDTEYLTSDEKLMLNAPSPLDFIAAKVAEILDITTQEVQTLRILDELPSQSRIIEESDGGEDIDDSDVSDENKKVQDVVAQQSAMRRSSSADVLGLQSQSVVETRGRKRMKSNFRAAPVVETFPEDPHASRQKRPSSSESPKLYLQKEPP